MTDSISDIGRWDPELTIDGVIVSHKSSHGLFPLPTREQSRVAGRDKTLGSGYILKESP